LISPDFVTVSQQIVPNGSREAQTGALRLADPPDTTFDAILCNVRASSPPAHPRPAPPIDAAPEAPAAALAADACDPEAGPRSSAVDGNHAPAEAAGTSNLEDADAPPAPPAALRARRASPREPETPVDLLSAVLAAGSTAGSAAAEALRSEFSSHGERLGPAQSGMDTPGVPGVVRAAGPSSVGRVNAGASGAPLLLPANTDNLTAGGGLAGSAGPERSENTPPNPARHDPNTEVAPRNGAITDISRELLVPRQDGIVYVAAPELAVVRGADARGIAAIAQPAITGGQTKRAGTNTPLSVRTASSGKGGAESAIGDAAQTQRDALDRVLALNSTDRSEDAPPEDARTGSPQLAGVGSAARITAEPDDAAGAPSGGLAPDRGDGALPAAAAPRSPAQAGASDCSALPGAAPGGGDVHLPGPDALTASRHAEPATRHTEPIAAGPESLHAVVSARTEAPARGPAAAAPAPAGEPAGQGGAGANSGRHGDADLSGGRNPGFAAAVTRLAAQAQDAAPGQPIATPSGPADRAQIAQQLARHIDSLRASSAEGRAVTVTLNQEHLGGIRLSVARGEAGVAARIVVENSQAHQAVEGAREQLRAALEQRGLNLASLEVSVGNSGGGFDAGAFRQQTPGEQAPRRPARRAATAVASPEAAPAVASRPAIGRAGLDYRA